MEIYYSSEFARQFKKLPRHLKKLAVDKEKIFRTNPFNPALKAHKLGSRLQGIWSFSLDYKHRLLFRFLDSRTVLFESVGDHSIYRH